MSKLDDDIDALPTRYPNPPQLPPELEAKLRAYVASDEWRALLALARFQELDEDDQVH